MGSKCKIATVIIAWFVEKRKTWIFRSIFKCLLHLFFSLFSFLIIIAISAVLIYFTINNSSNRHVERCVIRWVECENCFSENFFCWCCIISLKNYFLFWQIAWLTLIWCSHGVIFCNLIFHWNFFVCILISSGIWSDVKCRKIIGKVDCLILNF